MIKKLEEIATPRIELAGHKMALRRALLGSKRFQKKTVGFPLKNFYFLAAAPLFLLLVFFGSLEARSKILEVRAMEIAKNNPQVQALLKDDNVSLQNLERQGNTAYVLLSVPEDRLPSIISRLDDNSTSSSSVSEVISDKPKKLATVLVQVNLSDKKVENLKNFDLPISPLTKEEELLAVDILKNNARIKSFNIDYSSARIVVMTLPLRDFHLTASDSGQQNELAVTLGEQGDRRAVARIIFGRQNYVVTINLAKKNVEKISVEESAEERIGNQNREVENGEEKKPRSSSSALPTSSSKSSEDRDSERTSSKTPGPSATPVRQEEEDASRRANWTGTSTIPVLLRENSSTPLPPSQPRETSIVSTPSPNPSPEKRDREGGSRNENNRGVSLEEVPANNATTSEPVKHIGDNDEENEEERSR